MRFIGIFASGLVSGNYYNGGGISDTNVLKTSFALQVRRPSFLPTVRDHTDIVK